MYCNGKLNNTDKVLVDVGTGYYVEKSLEAAKTFYKGKIEFLKQQLESLQSTIEEKQNSLQLVADTIQYKVQNEKKE